VREGGEPGIFKKGIPMTETETSATPSPEIVRTFAVAPEIVFDAGEDIASELRELAPGSRSASEEGWQQGFDLMAAAWERSR
jgi:hypothetical protein